MINHSAIKPSEETFDFIRRGPLEEAKAVLLLNR